METKMKTKTDVQAGNKQAHFDAPEIKSAHGHAGEAESGMKRAFAILFPFESPAWNSSECKTHSHKGS